MAIARETNAALIKPLRAGKPGGAHVRRGTLGATTEAGELVTLQSDGKWDPSNGSAVQLTVGVALTAGVDGDVIDIVRFGPVVCLSDATIGSAVYTTDTAGEPDHTGGTKKTVVGYAETATILFVQPQVVNFS